MSITSQNAIRHGVGVQGFGWFRVVERLHSALDDNTTEGLVMSDQQEIFGACTSVGDDGAPHSSSFTRDMDRNVNVATAHLLLHEQQYFLIPVRYIDAVQ